MATSLSRALFARGANLSLRLASTAVRLALALVVTRLLGIEAAGSFALFQTSAILLGQLIGLDLFWWYSREIASTTDPARRRVVAATVRHSFARSYAVGLVLTLLPFIGGFIPWRHFLLFVAVAFLEQIAQELYRVLIAIGRPVAANVTFFIRSAAWVPIFIVVANLFTGFRSLGALFSCWLLGDVVALVVTAVLVERWLPRTLFARPTETLPVRESLKASRPYFGSSILTNVVEYSDRYLIAILASTADVGVYWILRGLCNVIVQASYFVVYEFRFPAVAAAWAARAPGAMSSARRLLRDGLVLALAAAICVCAGYGIVVRLIGRPELTAYWPSLIWVAGGAILASLATGLTFVLNALRIDRGVLLATAVAAATSVAGNLLLIPAFGIRGAAATFVLSSSVRAVLLGLSIARHLNEAGRGRTMLARTDEPQLEHV